MKKLAGLFFVVCILGAAAIAEVKADYQISGRVKVFKGPEGEVISTVPLNNGSKMLIHAHNTDGIFNEKTLIFPSISAASDFPKTYGIVINERNKFIVLNRATAAPNAPSFFDFFEFSMSGSRRGYTYQLTYSEELSAKANPKELLKGAVEFDPTKYP